MELAKKFLFKLDSKSVKILKDKSFVCYDTDTIKLVIEIIENDDYKDLYNSNIEVIFSYPNGESLPIKQTMEDGGIIIEDDSLISIIPKSGCLMPTDYMRVDINIYDEDEFVTLQPFAFKIYKSMEGEIVEEAEDIMKTIKDIDEQVKDLTNRIDLLRDKLDEELINVDNRLNDMVQNINDEMANLSREVNTTSENLVQRVNELIDRVSNDNIELDECFLRSTPLTPIDNNGKLLFSTEILSTSPANLINKSYILTTSGSPYVSTVITSDIGFLYFTLENSDVVINYAPIVNKTVQGNSISLVPLFDNGKASIESNASGYKINILTNLLTRCIDNATCTITSNTTLSNNI